MRLKTLSVATALLLILTGCGSGGGNDNRPAAPNNEIKNNQTTQNQASQHQTELNRLKAQLAQAQSEKQSTEEKLKQSEQLSTQDLNKAKQDLAQAEQRLKEAQKALQDEQVKARQATEKAKEDLAKEMAAKEKAVKELEAKLANDKILNRNEVLKFALQSGLPQGWANELADDLQNKSKSEVADEVLNAHKTITLRQLARNYGLNNQDARQFARENKNSTLDEAETLLESRRDEIQQKRQLLINEIFALAKEKGLPEWEAHNFAYGRNHTDKESAVEDLNNYVTEKAERETKINELINLAKEKGLEDWEAQNFANDNVDNDRTLVQQNLEQAVNKKKIVNELIQLAKEKGLGEWEAQNFANSNAENDQSTTLKNLEQFIVDRAIEIANEVKRRVGENIPQGFTSKYDDKTKSIYNHKAQEIGKERTYKDIYNQKYSIIAATYASDEKFQDPESARKDYLLSIHSIDGRFGGFETKVLPTEGNATYKGVGFTAERQGDLTYTVDFAKKEGEGEISGLKDLGTLHLDKGNIVRPYNYDGWGLGINSSMTAKEWKDQNVTGQYQLFFYGPNAEEIAGVATLVQTPSDNATKKLSDVLPTTGYSDGPRNILQDLPTTYPNNPSEKFGIDIGFGGTRGEIQK
ncbi:factor H binding protein domain-containing protein [Rodentibacter caecimuris]|uniref:factor H binding protein domain-containing protein n=1 Tax=Rodentibacter caecimuris TaxID=1796644 RepID=UPI0009849BD7|nr:factor H binding protein domain-containing protein [Rodentibacter heylii]